MNEQVQHTPSYNDLLDAVEVAMHQKGLVKVKIVHEFTPGLYTRSMVDVPPNTWLLSHIHKSEHQFIMSKGQIIVITESGGVMLQAPYLGKTLPNTRRLALTTDYVTWTSVHATDIHPADGSRKAKKQAVKMVEAELYEKHENIFLIKAEKEALQCQH